MCKFTKLLSLISSFKIIAILAISEKQTTKKSEFYNLNFTFFICISDSIAATDGLDEYLGHV